MVVITPDRAVHCSQACSRGLLVAPSYRPGSSVLRRTTRCVEPKPRCDAQRRESASIRGFSQFFEAINVDFASRLSVFSHWRFSSNTEFFMTSACRGGPLRDRAQFFVVIGDAANDASTHGCRVRRLQELVVDESFVKIAGRCDGIAAFAVLTRSWRTDLCNSVFRSSDISIFTSTNYAAHFSTKCIVGRRRSVRSSEL